MKRREILFIIAILLISFADDLSGESFCRFDTIEVINDSAIVIEEDCLNFVGHKTCIAGINAYEITESKQDPPTKVLYQKYLGSSVSLNEINSGYYFSSDTLHISWIEPNHVLNSRGMESFNELSIPRQNPLVKKRLFIIINESTLKDITTGWIYNKLQ